MTTEAPAYPITPRNRVKREPTRGHYDHATVHAILDSAMLCHVSYALDGQPFCTPTLHWREGDQLYWHGSSASRMIRHLAKGAPACLSVSHLGGLVMARSAFHHTVNFRSAMCFGTARLVSDPAEKLHALRAMVDRFFPGRFDALRPVLPQEIKATGVIAMRIEDASAKIRTGGVGLAPEDEGHPIWAGVIPVTTVIGTDEPCARTTPPLPRGEDLALYRAGDELGGALAELQRMYERG